MKSAEWIRGSGLVALICLAAGGSWAGGPLPEGVAEILERAANRSEARYMEVAVELAAEAYPERAAEIADLARALTPGDGGLYAFDIAPAAAAALPAEAGLSAPAAQGFFGELGLHGGLEGGLSLSTGNTDEQIMNTKLELTFERPRWRHKVDLTGDWTVTRDTTTTRRFIGAYETNYGFSTRGYVFGFLGFENDRFSGFDYQVSQSLGAGYKFFDGPRFQASLEAGPNLRQSKIKPAGNVELEYGGRMSGEFTWKLSETTSLNGETTLFFGNDRSSLDSSQGVKIKINDRLSGKLSYDVHWDGNVPDGRRSTDTVTRGTVVYDF